MAVKGLTKKKKKKKKKLTQSTDRVLVAITVDVSTRSGDCLPSLRSVTDVTHTLALSLSLFFVLFLFCCCCFLFVCLFLRGVFF